MRSLATNSMLRITFFSIFTSCESLRARSGPKAPAAFLRNACPAYFRYYAYQDWGSRRKCDFIFLRVVGRSIGIGCGGKALIFAIEQAEEKILTEATLAHPSAGLGRGQWRGRVLDLRGGRHARLAHRIGAMHGESV